MVEELLAFFRDAAHDETVRVIILTGDERAFCAGADLKERNTLDDRRWRAQHRLIEAMTLAIHDCPIPVLAAVEGFAYAGGFEIALGADTIVASETARFALTEVRRGIMPGAGGPQYLSRALGTRLAKELIFTARTIDAQFAYERGLVSRVVPAGGALAAAREIAHEITLAAPASIRMVKLAIDRGEAGDFTSAYGIDIAAYDTLVATDDRREGIAAFNERREPRWTGN